MGEYTKTYTRISELNKKKKVIQEKIDSLEEELYNIQQEIADCEGYLLELDSIDNTG